MFLDYLEWQTGDRIKAIQGIIPGWVNSFCNYLKDLAIPFMVAWAGVLSSTEGDLVVTMQAQPDYLDICLKIFAFLLFGYTLANVLKALILKFFYNIEGEKKIRCTVSLRKSEQHVTKKTRAFPKQRNTIILQNAYPVFKKDINLTCFLFIDTNGVII